MGMQATEQVFTVHLFGKILFLEHVKHPYTS